MQAGAGTGEVPPKRSNYRHGDLHRALVAAGTALARAGGPEAVVLRKVTRLVGVAPNAAYRHFADRQALLEAVCDVGQSALATAIEVELAAVPQRDDPVEAARDRLRAVGTGYLRFARAEPGLFRTAVSVPVDLLTSSAQTKRGQGGRTPFEMLSDAVDALVTVGVIAPNQRPHAEFLAWSAVHGLAMLLIQGPLRMADQPRGGRGGPPRQGQVGRGQPPRRPARPRVYGKP
ncbi:TetR/AcrR family transcriptional regulator, partial [Micromonospora gifhornensis]|uniref:TetR/AcrR family transcriptional regulator n=1 Tax=Micromonospora gifhornensis TaxID=84594 RepID=UPI003667293F